MSGHANPKKRGATNHPWWTTAGAIVALSESGKYPEAVKFMEKWYDEHA